MRLLACSAVVLGFLSSVAPAAFHLMQIEQIVGGVNGNPNAQAIQLRQRTDFQHIVSSARLRAWDAAGANPVLLLNIASDVLNFDGGARVLLTTPAFNTLMSSTPGYTTDFTLANPIPSSYLAAGKVTFEDDFGTIYWSLAWGGAGYTGTNLGAFDNDSDGNFGPPFGSALPTASRQGIIFPGSFSAASTTNLADYTLSADPATVTNNAGVSFIVAPEPTSLAMIGFGGLVLGGVIFRRRRK